MKWTLIVFSSLFTYNLSMAQLSQADSKSGIYYTATDYKSGNLQLAGDARDKTHKIKLNDFFGSDRIKVKHDGKRYDLSKDSIFGYHDKAGNDYRFYKSHSNEYRIVENKSIVIYEKLLPGNKQTGFKSVPEYFFSKGLTGEIQKLSIDNLKNAFRDNSSMVDAIELNFKSDSDLAKYDMYRKEFKVNYILAKK